VQDERSQFIHDVQAAAEAFAAICRRYGISRKTGYKWLERSRQEGLAGLADRSRAPHRQPHAVSESLEQQILDARAAHPSWGERKLKAWLERKHPNEPWPSHSTIGALLKRRGLTHARKRRRQASPSDKLTVSRLPNQVWAIDFKGWFCTGDGSRCDPLTVSDTASRFLLRCQAVARTDTAHVRPLLEAVFREYGLPQVILSDNGTPFSSTGLAGLSRLNVWWTRLGIRPERIRLLMRGAGPSRAERAPRAHAPHAEGRDGQAAALNAARTAAGVR